MGTQLRRGAGPKNRGVRTEQKSEKFKKNVEHLLREFPERAGKNPSSLNHREEETRQKNRKTGEVASAVNKKKKFQGEREKISSTGAVCLRRNLEVRQGKRERRKKGLRGENGKEVTLPFGNRIPVCAKLKERQRPQKGQELKRRPESGALKSTEKGLTICPSSRPLAEKKVLPLRIAQDSVKRGKDGRTGKNAAPPGNGKSHPASVEIQDLLDEEEADREKWGGCKKFGASIEGPRRSLKDHGGSSVRGAAPERLYICSRESEKNKNRPDLKLGYHR